MSSSAPSFSDYGQMIAAALDAFDRPTTEAHCLSVSRLAREGNEACPLPVAKQILQNLRRKRYFDLMQDVADSLIQGGQTDTSIWCQYGQALIDSGQLSLAKEQLRRVLEEHRDESVGLDEVRGLLGRAYKQLFVSQGGKSEKAATCLVESVNWYRSVYDRDASNTWHGINVCAMLARAARDGLSIPSDPDAAGSAKRIAADILEGLEGKWLAGTASMWEMGTAAEACVALDDAETAAIWTERYVREPLADAFELASTRRQLIEIWELSTDNGPGSLVLPVLEAQLLKKEGGELVVTHGGSVAASGDQTRASLEAILGRERYVSYKFMLRALECSRSVARIQDEAERGVGTGFLVLGEDLAPELGNETFLLTNCHVVSEDPYVTNPPALAPDEAVVVFGHGAEFQVVEVVWSSPPNFLDASILRLAGDLSNFTPLRFAQRLPRPDGEQRVYIIGHPRGGDLSFSIHDNTLIDHEGPPSGSPVRESVVRLHYRAPTEGGSSGSPVFNSQWRAIGLHHAGGTCMPRLNGHTGTHPANEGLWLKSISHAIQNDAEAKLKSSS